MSRKALNIKVEPTLLFQHSIKNIPGKIVWQATGVYKIIMEPGRFFISGRTDSIIVPITEEKRIWTFIFYGLHQKQTKYVTLSGRTVILNRKIIPEKFPLSTRTIELSKDKNLAFSQAHWKINQNLLRPPLLKLRVPRVEIPLWTFRFPFPQLKFPKYK
jgi:hypothetical protein